MPTPRIQRTINAILEKRGAAPSKDVTSPVPSDNEVVLPSTNTIATDTEKIEATNVLALSTSASDTTLSTAEKKDPTLSLQSTVGSFLFAPRPLPPLELEGDAGDFLKEMAENTQLKYLELMEYMVNWAYMCTPTWGERTLADVIRFYRDNRPMAWGF